MLREDHELLADLKRACNDAGPFVLHYLAGDLTTAAEQEYAQRLIDIGERLISHAKTRTRLVLDHESTPLILDAEPVLTTYYIRELLHPRTPTNKLARTTRRHESAAATS